MWLFVMPCIEQPGINTRASGLQGNVDAIPPKKRIVEVRE